MKTLNLAALLLLALTTASGVLVASQPAAAGTQAGAAHKVCVCNNQVIVCY